MTKKIVITICAMIVGFSTIFINQSTVKAEETTETVEVVEEVVEETTEETTEE